MILLKMDNCYNNFSIISKYFQNLTYSSMVFWILFYKMCFNELCGENDILTYNLQILLHIGILIIWKSCTTVIDLLHKKKFNSILFGAVLILVVKDLVGKNPHNFVITKRKGFVMISIFILKLKQARAFFNTCME